jgi:hypothetical protein
MVEPDHGKLDSTRGIFDQGWQGNTLCFGEQVLYESRFIVLLTDAEISIGRNRYV